MLIGEAGYLRDKVLLGLTTSPPFKRKIDFSPYPTIYHSLLTQPLETLTSQLSLMIYDAMTYNNDKSTTEILEQASHGITTNETISFLNATKINEEVVSPYTNNPYHKIPHMLRQQLKQYTPPYLHTNINNVHQPQFSLLILLTYEYIYTCTQINLLQANTTLLQACRIKPFVLRASKKDTRDSIHNSTQIINRTLARLQKLRIPTLITILPYLINTNPPISTSSPITHLTPLLQSISKIILDLPHTLYCLLSSIDKLLARPTKIRKTFTKTPSKNTNIKTFCHLDHHLPKCRTCGWRTSWVQHLQKHNINIIITYSDE